MVRARGWHLRDGVPGLLSRLRGSASMSDTSSPNAMARTAADRTGAHALDDGRWLASWIQSQHLERAALESYRERFVSHPARLVVVRNFLEPRIAERLS